MLPLAVMIQDPQDLSFFCELYDRNIHAMRAYALRLLQDVPDLADDAVQDAFINIARNIHNIHSREPAALRLYAQQAVKTAALKILDREAVSIKKTVPFDQDIEHVSSINDQVLDEICTKDTIAELTDLILKLPERYRIVLYCYYIGRMDFREIAESCHINYHAARKRFLRGRVMLIQRLQERGYGHESTEPHSK